MQEHGRVESPAELRGDRDVVVVTVRADDGHHVASGDGVDDGLRGVRGVEHHRVVLVADDPHVVVDLPTAAVEFERPAGDHAGDVIGTH